MLSVSKIAHKTPVSVHELGEHLAATGTLAAAFASHWGATQVARLAGSWHDIGKYADEFQAMIQAADPDAHLRDGKKSARVDHSTAGAAWAIERFDIFGRLLAYVIAGHHAGLPDWSGLQTRLAERSHLSRALAGQPPGHLLNLPPPDTGLPTGADSSFWVRMLGSAVFDADFLNTEEFFDGARSEGRTGWPELAALLTRLDQKLDERFATVDPTDVNQVRAKVLQACRDAADLPPGLFQFTVPTGGGKTLSALRFALGHGCRHGLRRVVYAAPFTSIIEQTAAEFAAMIGTDAVLEHHSALGPRPDDETARSRLAAENWDAPVVVTTTIQLFESLFASRPSRLRKIHNLAKSVIVIDEAQALPPAVLRPVIAVLNELVTHYGASIVLCTATQPSLGEVFQGFTPTEIAPHPDRLFAKLDRVSITLPTQGEHRTWLSIAAEMATEPKALAIVNRRTDCRTLRNLLPAGTFHLSTYQCARHRAELLADIKARLKGDDPVRVVSTSLIEAGVDIDFSTVFRAMAGLDSLAQAAGRCNREGKPTKGRFVVFRPEGEKPWGHVGQMVAATEMALSKHAKHPFRPDAFDAYFRALYWAKGPDALDDYKMGQLLGLGATRREGDPLAFAFREAANKFRMIEDVHDTVSVPYGKGAALIAELRRDGPSRKLLRKLQPFTVLVPKEGMARLRDAKALDDVDGVTVLADMGFYSDDVGLDWEGM